MKKSINHHDSIKTISFCLLIFSFYSLASFDQYIQAEDKDRQQGILHAINVGYGDAFLLELPYDIRILIDGGYPEQAKTVLQYLKAKNISHIHYLIMTHAHPDHAGAFPEIVSKLDIDEIWTNGEEYPPLHDIAHRKKVPIKNLARGDYISINPETKIEILNVYEEKLGSNEGSLVFIITFSSLKILFAGDIGIQTQQRLKEEKSAIKAHILKVPHHGTYLSTDFIKQVQPRIAIISVGENPYGAPSNKVLKMFQKRNIDIYRTDTLGSFTLDLDLQEME